MADPRQQYNRVHIARYFDEYGEQEWERMVSGPVNEVSLHIHTHYLKQHVPSGAKVLEVGAGPGRFTQILAQIDAHVTVTDISPTQLALNKAHAKEQGFARAVQDWQIADICDLNQFAEGSFDCLVAYGGPFSYALDRRDEALAECLRVIRPGGVLLLSVMSLWGTIHSALLGVVRDIPPETNRRVISSGDLLPETYENRGHHMHMFRAQELQDWLTGHGTHILALSAVNSLSLTWGDQLTEVRQDAEKWQFLLALELEAGAQPGALDMGTHLLAVVQKPV